MNAPTRNGQPPGSTRAKRSTAGAHACSGTVTQSRAPGTRTGGPCKQNGRARQLPLLSGPKNGSRAGDMRLRAAKRPRRMTSGAPCHRQAAQLEGASGAGSIVVNNHRQQRTAHLPDASVSTQADVDPAVGSGGLSGPKCSELRISDRVISITMRFLSSSATFDPFRII